MASQENDQSVSEYNREYYERNKKRIAERKKERYRRDSAYRKAIRKRTKESHAALRKRRIETGYDRRVLADGTVKYFSIGKIGEIINRSSHTIRAYHKSGIIPDSGHYDSRGWRLYTKEQALILKKLFKKFDKQEIPSLDTLGAELKKEWKNLNG